MNATVVGALVGGAFGTTFFPDSKRLLLIGAACLVVVVANADAACRLLLSLLADVDIGAGTRLAAGFGFVGVVPAILAATSACALGPLLAARPRTALVVSSLMAAAGALLAPWLCVLGPRRAVALVALVLLGLEARRLWRPVGVVVVACGVAVVALASESTRFAARDLSRALLLGEAQAPEGAAVFDERDLVGRVVVREDDDRVWFRDGKPDASLLGDLHTQAHLGLLPLLYAPRAQRALVIGLGSGSTAAWLADAGVDVDVVDISPAIFAAHGPLDPRIHPIVGDARAVLAHPPSSYDIVTSEPSNLFVAGTPRLFTLEAFRAMWRASVDGVVVVWLHAYLADDALVATVRASAAAAFPVVDVYADDTGDLFLVGHGREVTPAPAALADRLGARRGCAWRALGVVEPGELSGRRVLLPSTSTPLHRDVQPTAAPLALASLLSRSSATIPSSSTINAPRSTLATLEVLNLIESEGGRRFLAKNASSLSWLPRSDEPEWAAPLARSALSLLGGSVDVESALLALRKIDVERCANASDWDLALRTSREVVRRQPDNAGAVLDALDGIRSPLRRESRTRLVAELQRERSHH